MNASFFEIIARAMFSNRMYESFLKFFQEAWDGDYQYRVAMTRRCYNLHWAFRIIAEAREGMSPEARDVISQDALLLYAEEIADYFAQNRKFPNILIMDDVLLYGRGVLRILHQLENLLIASLSGRYDVVPENLRYDVHRSLLDALTIRVIAKGKQIELIDSSYLDNITFNQTLYENELLALSRDITGFLRKIDLPNNSNMLSLPVPRYAMDKAEEGYHDWKYLLWRYDGVDHNVYLRRRYCDGREYFDTIRVAMNGYYRTDNDVWLNALTQYRGIMPLEELDELCLRLLREVPVLRECGRFADALLLRSAQLQKQRVRILLFLKSVVCLYDFWYTYSLTVSTGSSWGEAVRSAARAGDLNRLSGTFARPREIERALTLFCADEAAVCQLRGVFLGEELMWADDAVSDDTIDEVNHRTEDYFYGLHNMSEREAYAYAHNLQRFRPRERGQDISSLDEFLKRANASTESEAIASALALHHHAVIAASCEVYRDETGEIVGVECTQKAGELSSYVVPRRFRLLLPALAFVEERCIRRAIRPRMAVLEFIKIVKPRSGSEEREGEKVEELKGIGISFVESVYSCGKSIRRWSRGLFRDEGWPAEIGESYGAFVRRENEIEKYYLEQAKAFVEAYHI